MNATRSEKTYSVMAAYYEGDKLVSETVVQEIKMAPGTDGIDTAIVKNEEGKTLVVYLRQDFPDYTGEDDESIGGNTGNNPGEDPGSSVKPGTTQGLKLGVVIIVIVIAIVVEALLLLMLAMHQAKKNGKEFTLFAKSKKTEE